MAALSAPVSIRSELCDPFLDTTSGKLQINQQTAKLLDLLDTFLLASWTSNGFYADDFVRPDLCSFQHAVLLVDDPKLTMCSHKDLFTLVVKVSTFVDMAKIFRSIFFWPK